MRLPFPSTRLRSCASLLLAGLMVSGCGERPAGGPAPGSGKSGKGSGGAAPVVVAPVLRKKVPLVIDAIGAIESMRSAAIRSQVTGTLLRIAFQEGQDVQAGDLLFEIDPRPFRNTLQTAEADLRKLRVQLEYAQGQVTRYRGLSSEQMVSREQFQKIQDDARAIEAQVAASEAAVANARLQLDYSSIRAPVGGRTGNVAAHEGDLIRLNDQTILVTINQLDPIYVTFGVPQQHLAALQQYRAQGRLGVRVVPPGADAKPVEGDLSFIDNTVDASTGTIRLKGTLPNGAHLLWPGQFANVTVTLAEPEVLTVPAAAVQPSQTGSYVYVVTAEKAAEFRPVVVERTFENEAVVTKGLQEGETVVIDGQLRVVPGRPVEIRQPGTAAPAKGGRGADGKGSRKKDA